MVLDHQDNTYVLDFTFSTQIAQLFLVASVVSPYVDLFSDSSLLHYLMPYLHVAISKMSTAGVSGNEEDQDVIVLLRDLTVSLLDTSRPINFEVGYQLFHLLLLAMRRGYIETERIPALTACVIAFYAGKPSTPPPPGIPRFSLQGSGSWVSELFDDSNDRVRDMRAIKEVICVLLGMREVEGSVGVRSDPGVSEMVMEVLFVVMSLSAIPPHPPLGGVSGYEGYPSHRRHRHGQHLRRHAVRPPIQCQQLGNQRPGFSYTSSHRFHVGTFFYLSGRFLPLLRAMTPIIHPTLAYLLLEVTTRVLLLFNNLTNGGGNSATPAGNLAGNSSYVYGYKSKLLGAKTDDSLICGILERAPAEGAVTEDEMYYTSTTVIEKCLLMAGPDARVALARFFPYYCLCDEDVNVRRVALQTIARYPDLVRKYYNEVLLR